MSNIYLQPQCSECGCILSINGEGLMYHSLREYSCSNNEKTFIFCSSARPNLEYSSGWLLQLYRLLDIKEIEDVKNNDNNRS